MKKHYWKKSIILIFVFLIFTSEIQTQDFAAKEKRYQQQFEELFNKDLPDTTVLRYITDSIFNVSPSKSNLPFTYSKKGIELAQNLNNPYWLGKMHVVKAKLYYSLNDISNNQNEYEKAIEYFIQSGALKEEMEARLSLSNTYSINSAYQLAINQCLKVLSLSDTLKSEKYKADVYMRISQIQLDINKVEQSVEYTQKAKTIFTALKDSVGIALTHEQMAVYYSRNQNFDNAIKEMDIAIEYAKNHPHTYYDLILMRGQIYADAGLIEKAIKAIDFVDSMTLGDNRFDYKNWNSHKRGSYLFMMGKYQECIDFHYQILEEPDINLNYWLGDAYAYLEQSYEELNQYDSAYYYHYKVHETRSERDFQSSINQMENLKTQYETKEKEATIALQEQRISQQRTIQLLGFGLAGVLALLFFQSYRNARARKLTNEALKESNKLLDIKNQQNEVLLKEIHHRVKNNLQTISSLLSLQSNSIEDPNVLDAVKESQNRVASMALIHQKLYQGENLAAIEMRDYFKTIGSAIFNSFGEKAKGVELKVDMPEMELDVDTAIPIGLITNELITNSLKYAFHKKENGKIFISLKKNKDNLIQLEIKDNGINTSTGISDGGTGFGTMLVKLLTTQLRGQMEQSTVEGTATIIKFSLENKVA